MTGLLTAFFASLGDAEQAIPLVAPDARFIAVRAEPDPAVPLYGTYHGHAGLRTFVERLRAVFDTRLFAVDTVLETDTTGFAAGRFEHRIRANGALFRSRWAVQCEFRDGRIALYRFFEDTAALEEALGVRSICRETMAS